MKINVNPCYLLLFGFLFLSFNSNAQVRHWSSNYDLIMPYSENLAVVRQDDLFGYVDKEGKEVIKLEWLEAGYFTEGLAVVCKRVEGSRYNGCIDKTGNLIIEFKYKYIDPFKNGVARVRYEDNSWGILDKKGNELISKGKYKYIGAFHENRASVMSIESELAGYVDERGVEVIAATFEKVWGNSNFQEGLALAEKDEKSSFIDINGNIAMDLESYDNVNVFYQGLAAAQKDGLWGFIDHEENLVIDYQYKMVWGFTETGRCWVEADAGWGVIDKKGEIIVEPQYRAVFSSKFSSKGLPLPSDIAAVTNDADIAGLMKGTSAVKWALITSDGNFISDFVYDEIPKIQDSSICVFKNELFAIIDLSGNTIIPFLLDKVWINNTWFLDNHGLLKGQIGKEWYYFDRKGNRLGTTR
jgi:hypothetical protein